MPDNDEKNVLELGHQNPKSLLNEVISSLAQDNVEPLKKFLQNNTQFLFESLSTHEELIGPVCDILEGDQHLMWESYYKYKKELITPMLESIKNVKEVAQKGRLLQQFLTQKSKYGMNALLVSVPKFL